MPRDYRDDDELVDALAEALSAREPMPSSIVEIGRAARGLLQLDAEIARLLDEADGALVGMRSSTDQPKTHVFGHDVLEIEVQLGDDVLVVVDPSCDQLLVVTTAAQTVVEPTDAGVYRFAAPEERFSILCRSGEATIRTPFLPLD